MLERQIKQYSILARRWTDANRYGNSWDNLKTGTIVAGETDAWIDEKSFLSTLASVGLDQI